MKAQVEIYSYLLIFLIASALTASALLWGFPLIQKKQDAKNLDDVYNFFTTLDEKIRSVARTGSEESLTLEVEGLITVYPCFMSDTYSGYKCDYPDPMNNSITFTFLNRVSNIALNKSIPLTSGTLSESPHAILGEDPPSVLFEKAVEKPEGRYEITYRLWYRGLLDVNTGKTHKIILKTENNEKKTSSIGFIRLKRGNIITDQNYILTEVLIIL
jgi:hypothetical protein